MIYKNLNNEKVSHLGFGSMRLPAINGEIDIEKTEEIIDYSIKNGVNYFDTAYPYHCGMSEIVLGNILNKYPREKWFLANKYPGHQPANSYDPDKIFQIQLKKCKVDYFDFYLLHNVFENSFDVYTDSKWGIIDYFIKQRDLGKIKHLGFSTHARPQLLKKFINEYGKELEFCQIQLNYLDWTLQNAKEKYYILEENNIPSIIMEPLRGGKLSNIDIKLKNKLLEAEPNWSPTEWSFRFLMNLPNNKVILSGMNSIEQLKENIKIFSQEKDFDHKKKELLLNISEILKKSIPCTSCGYCRATCPKGLNIPVLLNFLNEINFDSNYGCLSMYVEEFSEEKMASACIKCGKCKNQCPQFIDIPYYLEELSKKTKNIRTWSDISKEREEIAKKLKY